ncbi:MAG: hypothetical protein KDK66_01030 [Deltaproteobacteria bacterium]|nr:hypothetical protein [Deltaproteobacteria bacterium]
MSKGKLKRKDFLRLKGDLIQSLDHIGGLSRLLELYGELVFSGEGSPLGFALEQLGKSLNDQAWKSLNDLENFAS